MSSSLLSSPVTPALWTQPTEGDAAPQWFAVYTMARHEKQLAAHFGIRNLEHFLPLYRAQHRWRNGARVSLELPLFPSYIFVRITARNRIQVLETPGALSIVSCAGKPVPLPTWEIESLRSGVDLRNTEPHPYLVVGERVRIVHGALAGMEGVLLRKKGDFRVVLTLEHIMQSIAVEVDGGEVEPVKKNYGLRPLR